MKYPPKDDGMARLIKALEIFAAHIEPNCRYSPLLAEREKISIACFVHPEDLDPEDAAFLEEDWYYEEEGNPWGDDCGAWASLRFGNA